VSVTIEEVRRIAQLARLHPEESSLRRLTEELNGILENIRVLEEAEGESPPEAPPVEGSLPSRPPALDPTPLAAGAPGSMAPDWREGFFVVPRLPALDGGGAEG
jgi:Asp-tRNA(Asn)/Glu-tRNA(Gln) amidotransferase C subunit